MLPHIVPPLLVRYRPLHQKKNTSRKLIPAQQTHKPWPEGFPFFFHSIFCVRQCLAFHPRDPLQPNGDSIEKLLEFGKKEQIFAH